MAYDKQTAQKQDNIRDYVNDMEDRVDNAFDELGVDYIIEFGNDYEKWNSGKYVHRGTHSQAVIANENNSLTGPVLSRMINPTDSIVLANARTATANVGALTFRRAIMNASKQVTFIVHSTVNQTILVDYEVKGWWK